MIFEFLLPIVGWLVVFAICFVVYSNLFYKNVTSPAHVEGQAFYTALATFFWITVYMCLSSVWSILYSLIDLKYPDVIGAAANYGGYSSGAAYDTFAFPLAMTVVSAFTALFIGFWLISKFQSNKALRPERLYLFMRALVFVGAAILAFSGFVYVVYSWLYGNLPIAVLFKGIVAAVVVGSVALYFYLVADGKNSNEANISKLFSVLLVIATIATLYFSFQIIGTPAQARIYRLDAITIQNLQNMKYQIDNQDQSYGKRIQTLNEITDTYAKNLLKVTPMTYTTTDSDYTLCAAFGGDMPQTINTVNRDETWDYHAGNSCFTFKHLPTYANVNNQPKPIYNQ